jgi:hypothetical protein
MLQSGAASDLVQGLGRNAVSDQGGVRKLDSELQILDGCDATELLGPVVLVLRRRSRPTQPGSELGGRTA